MPQLTLEIFLANVDKDGPVSLIRPDLGRCWIWLGGRMATKNHGGARRPGYGYTRIGGRGMGAHRASYLLMVGQIPSGMHVDHLCRITLCVNPDHLEPVTSAENNRRARVLPYPVYDEVNALVLSYREAIGARCPEGHSYDDENTLMEGTKKRCRICRRAMYRRIDSGRAGRRRKPGAVRNGDKRECPAGHAYNEVNTAYERDGSRTCKECRRARDRKRSGRKRVNRSR